MRSDKQLLGGQLDSFQTLVVKPTSIPTYLGIQAAKDIYRCAKDWNASNLKFARLSSGQLRRYTKFGRYIQSRLSDQSTS